MTNGHVNTNGSTLTTRSGFSNGTINMNGHLGHQSKGLSSSGTTPSNSSSSPSSSSSESSSNEAMLLLMNGNSSPLSPLSPSSQSTSSSSPASPSSPSSSSSSCTPEIPWDPSFDVWWHEVIEKSSDQCEPVWVDAEDPLFILYTRFVSISFSPGDGHQPLSPLSNLDNHQRLPESFHDPQKVFHIFLRNSITDHVSNYI